MSLLSEVRGSDIASTGLCDGDWWQFLVQCLRYSDDAPVHIWEYNRLHDHRWLAFLGYRGRVTHPDVAPV